VHFPIVKGILKKTVGYVYAVDGVNLTVHRGKTHALVGESGCGKTTLGKAILRLGVPVIGEIRYDGVDLVQLSRSALYPYRRKLQIIFQDPYSSLNPRMTVAQIISEPLRNFGLTARLEPRVQELLATVGLDGSASSHYPHEFSGGQRQRIGIARALALNPALVVADEPASALDVSIQAQIINLLKELQGKFRLSYLFISHDLSVISLLSHRVAVMYLGEIVESGPTSDLFSRPWHPYTEALLSAVPLPDPRAERARSRILLAGDVPSPVNKPQGCPFHPRCPYVFERCHVESPLLRENAPGRWVSCHLMEEPARHPRIGSRAGNGQEP